MRNAAGPTDRLRAANVAVLCVPGALGVAGLLVHAGDPRIAWLHPGRSWHFAAIAACGAVASGAGMLDWRFHRTGGRTIPAEERRAEFVALMLGAGPLFLLMCCATLAERPGAWLVPVLLAAGATVVAVCRDEFRYHRRCGRRETAYHVTLVAGMSAAWLAWMHGCFVARGAALA